MAGRYAATDNAYVQQDMVSIVAEVAGRITDVAVAENQHVEAGDLLFRIDPEAYQIAYEQAEAGVAAARLQVEQMRSAYRQAEAELKQAQDDLDYKQKVFDRYQKLVQSGHLVARAVRRGGERSARRQADAGARRAGGGRRQGGAQRQSRHRRPTTIRWCCRRSRSATRRRST